MEDYNLNFVLFHGTTYKFAINILETKNFLFKPRRDHWLGNGIYFFDNDFEKAKWWARQAVIRNKESKIGILKYENFEIKNSQLLDLDTEQGRNIVNAFIRDMKKQNIEIKPSNTQNEQEDESLELRAVLIQMVVDHKKFIASKKTFTTDNPRWLKELDRFKIYNNQVQFCIYENNNIDFNKISIV